MPSFQQLFYCKNCKKIVQLNDKGQCSKCESNQLKKSWSVRFRYAENGKEKQKRLTGFQTKKEAQDGYIKFINEAKLKEPIETSEKIKFERLFEEYKAFTKTRIKESSYYDLCSKCNIHILPYFKDMNVQDITPKILLDWQNNLGTKYSFKNKICIRTYLNAILNYAEKYYNIPNNLKKVDSFRNLEAKKEMDFWTPEEFNIFIQKVDNETYKTFFYALYYTGARKGELLATNWNDWNLNKGFLNINKSVTKKTTTGPWLITTPKNQSSIRQISLPNILVLIMKKYKIGRENYKFVFAGDRPLAETSIARVKNAACSEAKVKKIRIHDFRHSHASLLISNGASIVSVAKRLGHNDIEQTLNTYAHMMPKEDDYIINILEKTANNLDTNLGTKN